MGRRGEKAEMAPHRLARDSGGVCGRLSYLCLPQEGGSAPHPSQQGSRGRRVLRLVVGSERAAAVYHSMR